MNKSLWIAKTGLEAQQTRMAVVANNLSNVNTTGFKKSRASFEDLIYQNVRQVGAQAAQNTELPSGLTIGTGVRTVSTEKQFSQGNLVHTDNSFDIAIQGRGFFQILMPDGNVAYTRDGSFQLNSDGQIVTSNGYELEPGIVIPEGAVSCSISTDGIVSVQLAGDPQPIEVGNIQLADFINPGGLEAMGQNLFLETQASGAPLPGEPGMNGVGTLLQGSLETSNVNTAEELINMIETQRAYETNAKVISAADGMLQYVNNTL